MAQTRSYALQYKDYQKKSNLSKRKKYRLDYKKKKKQKKIMWISESAWEKYKIYLTKTIFKMLKNEEKKTRYKEVNTAE